IVADFLAFQQPEWDIKEVVLLGDQSLLDEQASIKLTGALAMRGLGPVRTKVYPRGSPPLDLEVSERTVLVVTSYSVEDCIRLVNRYAGKCRMVGFLVAFASPELRAHVRSLPLGSYKGLYCLLPWKGIGSDPQSSAFIERFRAK